MKATQFVIPLTIILLCTLALYLMIAYPLLQDPAPATVAPPAAEIADGPGAVDLPDGQNPANQAEPSANPEPLEIAQAGRKRLEIHGRVVDSERRPLAGVVIAEERYFARTLSDDDGYYRLPLELPRHRYPVLHFLRSGYDSRRYRLGKNELDEQPVYRLDVALEAALDSVSLQGWIANDIGLGLEGARIELTASYTRNQDSFYLTEFSDENGNFEFDGVRAGEIYKLSVESTPEYSKFEDPDFEVTPNPAPLNIQLRALRFADLDGMVVNRSGDPVANYEIYITSVSTGRHSQKLISDSSGFFSLQQFPLGEIELTTRGSEYYRIAGMAIDDSAYRNLQIVVDRGNHYLSGWVADENGIAIGRAMVTLDRKFEHNGVEFTSYRSQSTGDDGKFAFESLGDGEYNVTVYSWGYARQEFSYRFEDQAGELFVALQRLD